MKTNKTAAKTAVNSSSKTSTLNPIAAAAAVAKAKTASSMSASDTTIDVKLDVGYGNSLFLRGQGAGLNWEHGVPLVCVDGKTWRWSGKVTAPVTFKVLINDQVWSAGHDLTVTPGQRMEVAPSF